MGVLSGLQPEKVFQYFEEICAIPHGSGNTAQISNYLCEFAKTNNLNYRTDEVGNVIIVRNASKSYEDADTVMLQGHMDMVCEKNADTVFDFKKEGLKLRVMDDYISAKGTTLGGDDGIAVAYMLAILSDDSVMAPRLECVITVDEETGMEGATSLDTSDLQAKTLINIDSEEEGIFLTSCAGGAKSSCQVKVHRKENKGICYNIIICGLLGGHSGTEINKYRANANILMGRLLHYLRNRIKYSLLNLQGGLQDNAIPREANAEILLSNEDAASFEELIRGFEKMIRNEYRSHEPNLQIYCVDKGEMKVKTVTNKSQERIIFLLNTIPDGVQKMSGEIEGLVQTSLNLGIMRLEENRFFTTSALRSSVLSEREALSAKLMYLTETIGGEYQIKGEYPAWEYQENSKIRELVGSVYRDFYGKEPVIEGIHAGLECGIIIDKMPGIDCISMGPDIFDIHTPKEKLSISSTQRCYEFLIKLLGELKA